MNQEGAGKDQKFDRSTTNIICPIITINLPWQAISFQPTILEIDHLNVVLVNRYIWSIIFYPGDRFFKEAVQITSVVTYGNKCYLGRLPRVMVVDFSDCHIELACKARENWF